LAVLTGLLVLRTYLSIWLADVNGQVVKAIVNRNFSEFIKRVRDFTLELKTLTIDPWFDVVRDPLLDSELGHGILQQVAGDVVQTAPVKVLPQPLPLEDVLLQDMQLGQPYPEPGPATDPGPRQVGPRTRLSVPQLH